METTRLVVGFLASVLNDRGVLIRMVGCDSTLNLEQTHHILRCTDPSKGLSTETASSECQERSLSINDFLSKIKNVIDRLASVGHVVNPSDHIEAIFNGLSVEYDTFIVSVDSRPEEYSVDEIESLLLAQETRIEKHIKNLDSNQVSVNLAMHENSNKKAYKGGTSNLNVYQHNYNKNYGQGACGRSNYHHHSRGGRSSNRRERNN